MLQGRATGPPLKMLLSDKIVDTLVLTRQGYADTKKSEHLRVFGCRKEG